MINRKYLILVADDNNQNVRFLGNFLTSKGFEVGVAQDGIETLEFVKNKQPDLILLDIMMPGMDGYEVCKTLKQDISVSHIPIIFITAKTETEDIVKGFKAGGIDYVTKPFVLEELLARVKTHLEMKTLRHLLPVCANCKKIRDDDGFWREIHDYIEKYAGSQFSHGICEECGELLYGDLIRK